MLKIQCPCSFSLFCGVEIRQLSLLSIGKKHEISNKMEHGIYFLRRRSKSLLASFFAFEDDGLNLLQFATAPGYRLGHMVLRKSEGLFPLSTHLCYNKTQSSPVYSIPANNNEVCMTNLHKYDSSKCLSYDRQGLQNCETTAVRVCYFFAAFF